VLLGEGVTRHELPLSELVERPFGGKVRKLLMMDGVFDEGYRLKPPKQPDRHRRKARAITAGGCYLASRCVSHHASSRSGKIINNHPNA
jgi:hypothetical protein